MNVVFFVLLLLAAANQSNINHVNRSGPEYVKRRSEDDNSQHLRGVFHVCLTQTHTNICKHTRAPADKQPFGLSERRILAYIFILR